MRDVVDGEDGGVVGVLDVQAFVLEGELGDAEAVDDDEAGIEYDADQEGVAEIGRGMGMPVPVPMIVIVRMAVTRTHGIYRYTQESSPSRATEPIRAAIVLP